MPYLEHEGTTRELTPGDTLIGSGSQAGWRLQNVDLAARHFTVTVDASGAHLKPLSAQHVVVVNGRQTSLSAVPLADGDVIEAGSARFAYLEDPNAPRATPAAPADEKTFLVDERQRVAYPLEKRSVSIGRDAASHVLVKDPSVSRFHADVRREAGQYVLYSMGSTGTKINGNRTSAPRVLEPGDRLELGDASFTFCRGALPPGVRRGQLGSGADEDRATRRQTIVDQKAVTGEGFATRRVGLPVVPIAIAVILLLAALVAYLTLRY